MHVTPQQAVSALPQQHDVHTSHAQSLSTANRSNSESAAERPLPATWADLTTGPSELASNESATQVSTRSQLCSAVKSLQQSPSPELLSHGTVVTCAQGASAAVNAPFPEQGTVPVMQTSSGAPQPASCTPRLSRQPQICADPEAAATPGPAPTPAFIPSTSPILSIPAPASAKIKKACQSASDIFPSRAQSQNQQQHFLANTVHSSGPNSYPVCKQVFSMVDDLSELEIDPDPATEVSANKPSLLRHGAAGIESPSAGWKRSGSQVPMSTTASVSFKKQKASISSAYAVAASSNSAQPTASAVMSLARAELQENAAQTAAAPSSTGTLVMSKCPEQPLTQDPLMCLPAKQNGPSTTDVSSPVSCWMPAACPGAAAAASSVILSKQGSCQPPFALLSSSVVTLHTTSATARPSIGPVHNRSLLPEQVSGRYKPVIEELPYELQPSDTNAKPAADKSSPTSHAMIIDSDSGHAAHSQLTPPGEAQQADSQEVQQLQGRAAEVAPEPAVQLVFASDEHKKVEWQQMPKSVALMPNEQGKPSSQSASVQARSKQPSLSLGIADIFSSFSALEDLTDADEKEEKTKPTMQQNRGAPAAGTCPSLYRCYFVLSFLPF